MRKLLTRKLWTHKLWTIAWKDLYLRFSDRNLILIMIGTPLALSTVVGLAFGGLGSDSSPIESIPMAVLNLDQGNSFGLNYGQTYVEVFIPASSEGLDEPVNLECGDGTGTGNGGGTAIADLTDTVVFDDARAQSLFQSGELDEDSMISEADLETIARAAVDKGIYRAVVIIPSDFSERFAYLPMIHPRIEETGVTVYGNSGSPISAGIVRSIVESVTNQLISGNITVASTFSQVEESLGVGGLGQTAGLDFETAFACAFDPGANKITLGYESVAAEDSGNTASLILVSVGSVQAMFFALFTAQAGVYSIHVERREWTLQRLLISPTSRSTIFGGKLLGVFVSVFTQLVLLLIALTLVGSILQGQLSFIWGKDLPRIALLLISASLAVSGFAMFMAGLIKSPEQGQVLSSVVNMGLAVLGGAFGFSLPEGISQVSILFWGRSAFDQLAAGGNDIGLHLAVLAGQGVAMFAIGLWLFNRRFEA
jgi:ABC-2 type transport system permease protein